MEKNVSVIAEIIKKYGKEAILRKYIPGEWQVDSYSESYQKVVNYPQSEETDDPSSNNPQAEETDDPNNNPDPNNNNPDPNNNNLDPNNNNPDPNNNNPAV